VIDQNGDQHLFTDVASDRLLRFILPNNLSSTLQTIKKTNKY